MFLAICLLSYSLLIKYLGFYWDDWPLTWISQKLGPEALSLYFSYKPSGLGGDLPVYDTLVRTSALGLAFIWGFLALGFGAGSLLGTASALAGKTPTSHLDQFALGCLPGGSPAVHPFDLWSFFLLC